MLTEGERTIRDGMSDDELLDDDRRFEDSQAERDVERERAIGDIKLDIQDADL
jgi:hypothetical protein